MPKTEKISIEFKIEDAQQLAYYFRQQAGKIDWVLENTPPKNPAKVKVLDDKAKWLVVTATLIEKALHARALNNGNTNIVKMG